MASTSQDRVTGMAGAPARPSWAARVRRGAREVDAWLQLVRFAMVGASGYVVNLVTFTLLVTQGGVGYRTAATGAFLVAVTNNFVWNHRWTFRMAGRAEAGQALRFLCVSLTAFAVNLLILTVLVDAFGLPEVPSQAAAIVAATPLSFMGNRLWTFARR
jgi:putative flippase GtrA